MSEDSDDFKPRNYQEELMQIALKQNTIIYLPTGAGKTYIAVLVLKQLSEPLLIPWREGGKISVILVNTVALVHQHGKYLERHTTFKVGCYSGELNVDFWNHETWNEECDKHQILIMTSQILTNAVEKNFIDLARINLLVFDECHRGVNDHAMRQLMKTFEFATEQPRVLGLTATLLNGNCLPSQVEREVHALETTYHSKVATVGQLEEVIGYSTNPQETTSTFAEHVPSEVESVVIANLTRLRTILTLIKLEEKTPARNSSLRLLQPRSGLKELANLVTDAIYHIEILGPFGGVKALTAHTIQIERLKRHCDEATLFHILNSVITDFTYAKNLLSKQFTGDVKVDVFKYSSPKVKLLLSVIAEYKSLSEQDLCAIVFVQRRFTAKILFHILKCVSENLPEFSYIKPNFMVGYNSNPYCDTRETLYLSKTNRDIVQKFYTKDVNFLCASNVLEEGIDVPRCSLVIKFDWPVDYRSYIQSKGRARHTKSLYYIMVQQGEEAMKFFAKYLVYQEIERKLNEFLIGKNKVRIGPSEDELRQLYDEHEISPYYVSGPGSAQVNMVSACSLLSQYCSNLLSDVYTSYNPEWYFQEKLNIDGINHCSIVIYLPTVCPILDPIEGPYMVSKKQAKRAAALKACIMLHKAGELDDNLKPVKHSEVDENTSFLFSHWPKDKEKTAGNNKMSRNHLVHVPWVCRGQINTNSVYIHVIDLQPNFNVSNSKFGGDRLLWMDMYSSRLCYAIVTRSKFPELCEFPIFVSAGEIAVNVRVNVAEIRLSEEEFKEIQEFNYLIFNDVLRVLKEYLVFNIEEDAEMLMVIPWQKDEQRIDYDVIRENKFLASRNVEPSLEEKLKLKVDEEGYIGKIVTPWYRAEEIEYLVIEVCHHMDAFSHFPTSNFDTYFDYFKSSYETTVLNPRQPLLRVRALSSRLNCLKPGGAASKRNKEKNYEDYEIHYVPELVVKQNFPGTLWIQAKLLPSILDKTLQLLRAEELRQTIANECNLGVVTPSHGWEALTLDLHLLHYAAEYKTKKEEERNQNVDSLEWKDLSCISRKLNIEIAMKKLNDEYPWEKGEEPIDIDRNLDVTVMDIQYYENFLMKSVSSERPGKRLECQPAQVPAITFHQNFVEREIEILKKGTRKGPELAEVYRALASAKSNDIVNLERLETLGDSFLKFITSLYISLKYPKYDEGQSTVLKGKLISNKNLYYIAAKKKLDGFLRYTELKPKTEWAPPCYGLPKILEQFAQDGTICNSTLLNIDIPLEEQVTGILSSGTQRSILKEAENSEQQLEECDSTLTYYSGCQFISDKAVADVVESTLGVYLQSCGITGGVRLMEWLGIIPKSENLKQLLESSPQNPVLNPSATQRNIDYHIPNYQDIEQRLGYRFKNRAYLLQALTHSSYTPNRVTACYQRLEFLGDAVLDFLITCYIYESCGYLTPGDLTDLRSALVNNVTFACLVVRCGFHKFLLAINCKLQSYIDNFLILQESKDFAINDDVLILLNEDDMHLAENIDVPKVLGDLFEALVGAVFLDSGKDLKTVWKVFYKIMWKEIETFSSNVPKNAIRVLHETLGAHPSFKEARELDSGKVMVKLDFMNKGTLTRVHGFGDNKKVAKKAAAKIALRLLGC